MRRPAAGSTGIVLTHDHADHAAGGRRPARAVGDVPVAASRWEGATERISDGVAVGPFTAIATPGHAPDHLAFLDRGRCFTGDAVLGHGSVFVAPDPGALTGYLAALERLLTSMRS